MPRLAGPLTDVEIRNSKPRNNNYDLSDGSGLSLEVPSSGTKRWRFRYRYFSVEKQISLGVYPSVSLKRARELRNDAKELLANEIDPSRDRKMKKLAQKHRIATTFEVVARECLKKYSLVWGEDYLKTITEGLEKNIFPYIGSRPISEVSELELLDALRRIEARGSVATAHRTLDTCGQILRYGVASGRQVRDFSGDLKEALILPKGKHRAAITKPNELMGLLHKLDRSQSTFVVRSALQLALLVFVRPIELRVAKWADIDFHKKVWTFKKSKRQDSSRRQFPDDDFLIVPLSRQSLDILRKLRKLTAHGIFIFPGQKRKANYIGSNTINSAMHSVGIKKEDMSFHGFRATARTILAEVLLIPKDIIELQLGHIVRDSNGRAYNRTEFLLQRRLMMQMWADYLDSLRTGKQYALKSKTKLFRP
jgi:integrase